MRSHEFIIETITIVDYQEQFEKVIVASIKVALINLANAERAIKQIEHEAEVIQSILPLLFTHLKVFYTLLRDELKLNVWDVFSNLFTNRYSNDRLLLRRPRSFSFRSNMTANGSATGLSISLNERMITEISAVVSNFIKQEYKQNVNTKDSGSIADHFYKIVSNIANRPKIILEDPTLQQIIHKWANTMTHELVHVFQHAEQYKKKRISTEYRSYAEKDPAKFQTAVRRLTTPDDYKIYRASPQEITAFAHNIASQILKNTKFRSKILWGDLDQSNYSKIISDYVAEHLKYTPEQRKNTNYIERKVFNRYVKQVYQILQHYVETEQEKFYSNYKFNRGFNE